VWLAVPLCALLFVCSQPCVIADLKSNTHLVELKLSALQLRESVIVALCQALASNTALTKLDLASNPMTEPAVKALVECLKVTTPLPSLRASAKRGANRD
jgi:hypothetical protein